MAEILSKLQKKISLNTSDEVILSIKHLLDLGFDLNDAAIFSGVSRATLYGWIENGINKQSSADELLQKLTTIKNNVADQIKCLDATFNDDLSPAALHSKIKKIKEMQELEVRQELDKQKKILIQERIKKKIEAEKLKSENEIYRKNLSDFKRLVGEKILKVAQKDTSIQVPDYGSEISGIAHLIEDRGFIAFECGYISIKTHPEAEFNNSYRNPKRGHEKVFEYQKSGATKYQHDIIEYLEELKGILRKYKAEMMSFDSPQFKFIDYLITIESKLKKYYTDNDRNASFDRLIFIARSILTQDPQSDFDLIYVKKCIGVMNSLVRISNLFVDDVFEVPVYQVCWNDFWDRTDGHEDIYEANFMNWLGSKDGIGFVSLIRDKIENSMYLNVNNVLINLKINVQVDDEGRKITSYVLGPFSMPFKHKYIEDLFSEYGYRVKILNDENKNKEKNLQITWQE